MSERTQTGKIVFLLLMMIMIFVVLGFLSVHQLKQSEEIRSLDEKIEKVHLLSLDIFKTDVNFFRYDVIGSEFFKTGQSENVVKHDSLVQQAQGLIKTISETDPFGLKDELEKVSKTLSEYEVSFTLLAQKLREKGFKDYGFEGKLRNYAHDLEDKKLLTEGEILMLRRHEKDYLLRHEEVYTQKFDALKNSILKKYASKPATALLVEDYSSTFHDLVTISNEIGMETQQGLKGIANDQATELVNELRDLSNQAETITQQFHRKSLTFFVIAIIIGALISFVLIVRIAKKL